jgi:LuxR family transcriptional regulator/LuxR family quorum-sensing system transcriptional regulator CciR
MSNTDDDLGSFLKAVAEAHSPEVLWHTSVVFFKSRNIPLVSYHLVGPGASDTNPVLATTGFRKDWVCQYIEEELFRVDPIPELALATTKPFFWHDIEHLRPLLREQRNFMRISKGSGVGDGIAMQVFGPNLRNGYVGLGFGGARRIVTPTGLAELQFACQAAHLRYCALCDDVQATRTSLAPREREILGLIARGKSNAVIADILGISHHTVDTYTRRIFDKLDVGDRTTAAIRGIGSGLIAGAV